MSVNTIVVRVEGFKDGQWNPVSMTAGPKGDSISEFPLSYEYGRSCHHDSVLARVLEELEEAAKNVLASAKQAGYVHGLHFCFGGYEKIRVIPVSFSESERLYLKYLRLAENAPTRDPMELEAIMEHGE